MDDIIDLELEKIEKIIAKIDSDPESEEVKEAEKHLWEKIYKKSGQGRRTGVGITAEGDMLAAMGLRYGTEDATEFSEQVHKTIALEAYRSSVNMAKERGAFAIYDSEREKNNPFTSVKMAFGMSASTIRQTSEAKRLPAQLFSYMVWLGAYATVYWIKRPICL